MSEGRASLVSGMQITKAVSLLKPLSSGGMGAVWLADHLSLKTRVVVKFMLVGLDASDSARTRFSREAAAAAQVKSPHVVQMLDHGVSDHGVPFIVMEHLEGHDLGDEIEQNGAIDPAKAVLIVSQVAKALSKVHAAGLLHRDIKPDNIFLVDGEEDVFVKLLDFGIAKSSTVDPGDGSLDGETKTGQIVGTPFYMSPEQVTAQKTLDLRSDLWALGVVAYEALTGQRPYDGPSFGALAVKIATGAPPRPSDVKPNLPPAVDAWFAKACALDPRSRFSSAKEMAEAFRAAFDGVVSLPSSAVSSDSGQRGLSSSSGTRNAGSGARDESGSRSGSATFGFAATAAVDASAERSALERPQGASGDDSSASSQRSTPPIFIGGAVALTIAAAVVLAWSLKAPARGSSPAPGVSAPQPVVLTASIPAAASASAVVAKETEPPPSAVVDAAPPATASGAPRVPTVRHTGHANPSTSTPVRPSSSADAPPKPVAKPASSEPDLF